MGERGGKSVLTEQWSIFGRGQRFLSIEGVVRYGRSIGMM